MNIGILWKSGGAESWTDVFKDGAFSEECKNELFIHPVMAKGEKIAFASCLKTVISDVIRLDYRPFKITNSNEGMMLGVVEFEIDRAENKISNFTWKNQKSEYVEKVRFEQVTIKRCPKVPQRIFDLLACEDVDKNSSYHDALMSAFSSAPKKITVNTKAFIRNPIVVREALKRAGGVCQKCDKKAPFISKVTKEPYLEVHHVQPLSENGEDTLENVIAICPNCHREAHFGESSV